MGHEAEHITHPHTLQWFRDEQYMPDAVIDRQSVDSWREQGAMSASERAKSRVDSLLDTYVPSSISDELRRELRAITVDSARRFGMENLPDLPAD
ncbi:MAG: hypothetical protein GTO18_06160 [Anaerolineales bacterium]|nr:hypothetical protein [Anaerolineales bacterium]